MATHSCQFLPPGDVFLWENRVPTSPTFLEWERAYSMGHDTLVLLWIAICYPLTYPWTIRPGATARRGVAPPALSPCVGQAKPQAAHDPRRQDGGIRGGICRLHSGARDLKRGL